MAIAETRLLGIRYEFRADPLDDPETEHDTTNCRRAAQVFYFVAFGMRIKPSEILSAESYDDPRNVVWENTFDHTITPDAFPHLIFGDLIHAERKKRRRGDRNSDYWKRMLHLGVYIGRAGDKTAQEHFPSLTNFQPDSALILHSSPTIGKTGLSTLEQFLENHNPVRATRIPDRFRNN